MSFSFGTPSSAPATGLSGGFNFGANKPASTPGFGLGAATTQASTGLFGTPATSAPAFGTTTPAFGSSFGGTSTASAFGVTSTAPAFGANTSLPAPAFGTTFGGGSLGGGGLNFGTGTNTTAATGLSFNTSTTSAGLGGFGFGTTQPSGGLFGPTSTATTATSGFAAPGLGLGGVSQPGTLNTTGLSFNTATTSAGLGGLGGFGFGTTQSSGGLFGPTSTTTATSGFGSGLGTTNVTGTLPSSSAAPSLGLGGVSQPGTLNATASDGKTEPPKQTKLPNEISTTVESFKEFVKKQKSLSSDVMRVSIKPLHKVGREAESTLRAALALRGECGRARAHSRRLRAAAAAALAAAEGATREPPGLELEGLVPPTYVKDLIAELEQQLITFRRQMDEADKQMQSSPKLLTEQELTLGIRRMHESLVALAGRLQTIHTQVDAQKEQYLNLRKYVLKDTTNVFKTPSSNANLDQILHDAEGNKKKLKTVNVTDITLGSAVLTDPRVALSSNVQQLAGPTPFSYVGTTLSSFPSGDTTGSNWQPPQPAQTTPFGSTSLSFNLTNQSESSFNLQKPPGKRGKQ